jgi:hypothetical protein
MQFCEPVVPQCMKKNCPNICSEIFVRNGGSRNGHLLLVIGVLVGRHHCRRAVLIEVSISLV